jgi:hypothetical protein
MCHPSRLPTRPRPDRRTGHHRSVKHADCARGTCEDRSPNRPSAGW